MTDKRASLEIPTHRNLSECVHLFKVLYWLQKSGVYGLAFNCSLGNYLHLWSPHTKVTHCVRKSRGVCIHVSAGVQSILSRSLFTLRYKINKCELGFSCPWLLLKAWPEVPEPVRDKHGCQTSVFSLEWVIVGTLSTVWSVGPVQEPSDEEMGEWMHYPSQLWAF